MKMLTLIGLLALLAPQGAAPAQPAGCAPRDNIQFVCGLVGPRGSRRGAELELDHRVGRRRAGSHHARRQAHAQP